MRTLVVVEHLRRRVPGGVGTYARGLLGGLAALAQDRAAEPVGAAGDREGAGQELDIHLYAGPTRLRPDPLAQWGFPLVISPVGGAALTRLWDRGLWPAPTGYDAVHSVSLAFPPTRQAPLSLMVHDLAFREVPDAFPARGRRWHEAALGRAMRRAAVLVAPSRSTAAALESAGAPRVEVIEHGADHLPPADLPATDSLLGRLGVDGPFLLSVGTQEPRKNLGRVMQAYRRARSRLPGPWPLVVVGPAGWGPAADPVEGAIPTGTVEPGVLAGLYARARCLVYVPLLEGFGFPPVEAMVQGCPVVASPMPSTAGASLEVDPLDVPALADALVEAAVDGPCRGELVRAGARRASELTWTRSARRHLELWKSLR